MNERNRARLRRTVSFIKREGWEITLISEVRARSIGVIFLGEGEDEAAINHSERSRIILLGTALEAWKAEGQRKNFADRITSGSVGGMAPDCSISTTVEQRPRRYRGIQTRPRKRIISIPKWSDRRRPQRSYRARPKPEKQRTTRTANSDNTSRGISWTAACSPTCSGSTPILPAPNEERGSTKATNSGTSSTDF